MFELLGFMVLVTFFCLLSPLSSVGAVCRVGEVFVGRCGGVAVVGGADLAALVLGNVLSLILFFLMG
jgi:hypothetical protein